MTTTEVLRRQLDEAYRRWQEAWSNFGYDSPQEREAFERIKQLGMRVAEASTEQELEWTKRMVADYLSIIRQDLDARLEPDNRDPDEIQKVTGGVQQRLDKLQKALHLSR